MKKLILAMVFVFATGTMMNANSSNEKIITPTIKAFEIVEDFGCASDCVEQAKLATFKIAVDNGELPSMDDYHEEYENCYYSNCV